MIEIKISKLISYIALAIVFIILVWGFSIIDGPAHNRKKSLDKYKIQDLQTLENGIERYFNKHKKLPSSFVELQKENSYFKKDLFKDNVTNKLYDYKINDNDTDSYELCAEFELPSDNLNDQYQIDFWKHDSGYYCFKFNLPSS